MGRGNPDSDTERLPHGMSRIGYDADDQTYTYRDADGSLWRGAPGHAYGTLSKVRSPPPSSDLPYSVPRVVPSRSGDDDPFRDPEDDEEEGQHGPWTDGDGSTLRGTPRASWQSWQSESQQRHMSQIDDVLDARAGRRGSATGSDGAGDEASSLYSSGRYTMSMYSTSSDATRVSRPVYEALPQRRQTERARGTQHHQAGRKDQDTRDTGGAPARRRSTLSRLSNYLRGGGSRGAEAQAEGQAQGGSCVDSVATGVEDGRVGERRRRALTFDDILPPDRIGSE